MAKEPNPFGRWQEHRARIAALSRSDARDPEAEADARRMLKASRLADAIMEVRDELTDKQRATLVAKLMQHRVIP